MVPLGLNYIRIRAHCSFIGRCLRYFIRPLYFFIIMGVTPNCKIFTFMIVAKDYYKVKQISLH
ncbi:hypothetical protein T09_13531 [Trichinella sp. T9]|nr:hypothetical protein T09_13531 [Trichinella sp. T9]